MKLSFIAILAITLIYAGLAIASPPPSYRLQWADEFTFADERIGFDQVVDLTKWDVHYPWGNTHNHNAASVTKNTSAGDGYLTLNALEERSSGKDYTTGVVNTADTFRLDSGYIEARMMMPNRWGSWPAFWMLNSGWPPEIDIMEYPIGQYQQNDEQYYTNYFWGTQQDGPPSNGSYYNTGQDLGQSFHTFGLLWNSDVMEFYFDGTLVKRESRKSVLDHYSNMYLILNYAVGGWPGNPPNPDSNPWPEDGDQFVIDWVRVWQEAPVSATSHYINGDGSWHTWDNSAANWSVDAPNLERHHAEFGTLTRSATGTLTPTMEVRWDGSRTVGQANFTGQTVYTIGEEYTLGDAQSDTVSPRSLMFADRSSGWSKLQVLDGPGGHVINSRLDAWSNLVIRNQAGNALTINGNIIGPTRGEEGQALSGGRLKFADGMIVINGNTFTLRDIDITDGVTVVLNGAFYQSSNTLYSEAHLRIDRGATLILDGLNGNSGGEGTVDQSLGSLGTSADRIQIDNGTLVLRGETATYRGFTIGSGGATLQSEIGASVWFRPTSLAEKLIVSTESGDLTLAGEGDGKFDAVLSGDGGLLKSGSGTWSIGSNNTYSGITEVSFGILLIEGATGLGDTYVQAGGTLGGIGQVQGRLDVLGTVEPGLNSVGTLFVESAVFRSGSKLTFEIASSTTYDRLVVNDSVDVETDAAIEILLLSGYTPEVGDSFDFLDASSLFGEFSTINLPPLDSGLAWNLIDFTSEGVIRIVVEQENADFNGDGYVGVNDLDILLSNWGDTVPLGDLARGDGTGDGFINEDDLNVVLSNWRSDTAVFQATVPEPSMVLMFILSGLLSLRRGSKSVVFS